MAKSQDTKPNNPPGPSAAPEPDTESADLDLQAQLNDLAERLLAAEDHASEAHAATVEASKASAERLLAAEAGTAEAMAVAVAADNRAAAAEARLSTVSVDAEKEVWARRLAVAKSQGLEVQAFNLTNKRHMKQVGDRAPELVYGSPTAAIKVLLPALINRKYQEELEDESGNKIRDKHGRPRRGGPFVDNWIPQPEDQHLTIAEAATVIDTRPGIAAKRPPLAPPAGAQKSGASQRASDTL